MVLILLGFLIRCLVHEDKIDAELASTFLPFAGATQTHIGISRSA
jgi:hypothetical protein